MHGQGLRVRLTVKRSRVNAFEDPGFVVHLDNVGRTSLRLNPHIASNIYVYDENGQFLPAPSGWIAEFIVVALKKNDLVLLPPGETFSQEVTAEYRPRHDMGSGATYYNRFEGKGGLLLRGGNYTAKFVYVNAPGFPANYAPRDFPNVWEGRLESDAVRFTVASGAEQYLDTYYPFRRPIPGRAQTETRTAQSPNGDLEMSDEGVRGRAMSLLESEDPSIRALALSRLAERCTTSLLPIIQRYLVPASNEWSAALGKCGSAETFLTLRPLLDSSDERTRRAAASALYMLTFEGSDDAEVTWRGSTADWDRWYERHKNEPRRTWAERQLRNNRGGAYMAIDYLRRTNDPQVLPTLRRAAVSATAEIRILAARGIATFDRSESIALLKREFENRNPQRSAEALSALNELTDRHDVFDFHVPAERQQAVATYAPIQ